MTPAARLQAVIDLLTEIENTPRPADALASAYFRSRRFIGSKDRSAIQTMLYGILRHYARLGWWITENKATPSVRTYLLAYITLIDGKKAEVVDELFSGGKFSPASMTPDEGRLMAKLAGHTIDHPKMPDDVRLECPPWATEGLRTRFGSKFVREMAAMLQTAPLDLRVNSIKAERDTMLKELQALGLKATAGELSPYAIRVAERPSLAAIPQLKNGQIEIQDEGSQLIALLLDAKPGDRVVDFCAGAGGKTLAIAATMKNKGRVIACDVLAGRLQRSTERFRRAGLHNIEVRPLSSESDPWVKRHKASFDRVLVDAPCSGTGTWRRNPDSRWRQLGPSLEELIPLQAKILASAARLVKPGGRLVYATCSMLPAENDDQIAAFLAAHTDFETLPLAQAWALPTVMPQTGDYLCLTPSQNQTDGFFAAILQRKAAAIKDEAEEEAKNDAEETPSETTA